MRLYHSVYQQLTSIVVVVRRVKICILSDVCDAELFCYMLHAFSCSRQVVSLFAVFSVPPCMLVLEMHASVC